MPVTVSVRVTKKRSGINTRELAQVQAEAARDYLQESLVNGYRPADGAARPRKGDGKPLGFDTGVLSRSLRVQPVHTTRNRSVVKITAPNKYVHFLRKQDDVLVLDGIVKDEMDFAAREYLESQE